MSNSLVRSSAMASCRSSRFLLNTRSSSPCTWVRTPFIDPLMRDPDRLAAIEKLMPLGRIAEPEETEGDDGQLEWK